ncbi:glycosyltransferase [Pseudanabaena sp. lw0831]|uniref:glycosyltransferase n=1 Tax=Pseudanabaena sp. lw0831 TaxID=1357935 RepID=UPI0019161CC3|nr:glycosyltransferase [Pseudanabaena sp. lw0831]GBO52280.1 glycosyltransferase [Pseudanabaena sp. lw0831]
MTNNIDELKKQPLVSVGIPTYNRPDGLKRTLECITQQTHLNLEIIVSDNCSTDPNVEIVVKEFQKKDARIHYFRQIENKGAGANFLFVLKQAMGKYFMWAADDDEWEPEFIQVCLANFDDHTTLVFPKMSLLYRNNNLTEEIVLPNISRNNSRAENVSAFLDSPAPSMFYGLHLKESLIRNYEQNYDDFCFDFADCSILTKILLNGQVEVLNSLDKALYIAGVDNTEYVIKAVDSRVDRMLVYSPYIMKQISLIFTSTISLKDKVKLVRKVLITTSRLFLWHEKNYKDINIFNKLKFFTVELLIMLDSNLVWVVKKIRQAKLKKGEITKNYLAHGINESSIKEEKNHSKISYSQSGEDLIIRFIFDAIGIQIPSYIDIGAYHPEYLSNTALFYQNGSRGINIEPDPQLFESFKSSRAEDINLNIGIDDVQGARDFYIISTPTLNTFSKEEAENCTRENNHQIVAISKTKVDVIPNVIQNCCKGVFPDFLSLDVEGLDLKILQSINYEQSSPLIICVETISFSETGNGVKDIHIIQFLESKGYMVYADTYINTIFIKKDKWLLS